MLPQPEWGRDGETWRIEGEPHLRPATQDDEGDDCMRRDCGYLAVAYGVGNSRLMLCERHLSEVARAWVEGNRVVSWRLSK
jgi:hypothetical protein